MRRNFRKTIAAFMAATMALCSTGITSFALDNKEGYLVKEAYGAYSLIQITESAMQGSKAVIPAEIDGKKVNYVGDIDDDPAARINKRLLEGVDPTELEIGPNVLNFTFMALEGGENISTITVNNNPSYAVEDGALYGVSSGKKLMLFKYAPASAKKSFTIPETVQYVYNMDHAEFETLNLNNVQGMYVKGLADTSIDKLVVKKVITDPASGNDDVFHGANIAEFEAAPGSEYTVKADGKLLMNGNKLIKAASGATKDDIASAGITTVSPYAFDSIEQYNRLAPALSSRAKDGVVFNFYNQDDGVFIVNGELGFCYDNNSAYPTQVGGDPVDYDGSIDAAHSQEIMALLYAGVPNDGFGIFKDVFGMSYVDAKAAGKMEHGDGALNEVSRLIYLTLGQTDAETTTNLAVDDFFTEEKLAQYREALQGAMNGSTHYAKLTFYRTPDGYQDILVYSKKNISISKVDVTSEEEVENAHIQIIKDGAGVIHEWNSTNEPHVVDGLETNVEYILRETVAPEGYTIASDTTFTINEDGTITGSAPVNSDGVILVKDTKTSVTISKVDATTEQELPGAILQVIEKNSGEKKEEWTSTEEPHVIEGLKINTEYIIRETTPPAKYNVTTDTTFVINEDGSVTVGATVAPDNVIIVEDEPIIVKISKQAITAEAGTASPELPGAHLTVKKASGEEVESWVSGDQPHEIQLANGDYTLTETLAPDNYEKAETIAFTITDGKVTNVTNGEKAGEDTVIMYDALKEIPKIKISKQDIAYKEDGTNAEELEGAHLVIKNEAGEEVVSWTSGRTPHEVQLADGKYTLTETIPPTNYQTAETIEFTVTDGKVGGDKDTLIMYDAPVETPRETIKISKQDIAYKEDGTNAEELEGAHLVIKNEAGEEVASWTSGEKPHEVVLDDGKYTLTETIPPTDYQVAETIEFVVEGGKISGEKDTLIMYDAPDEVPEGGIKISKQDIAYKEDGTAAKELVGAHLILATKSGDLVDNWTSGRTPHTVVLEDGDYVLTEETAPKGYVVAESIEFTVTNGKVDGEKDSLIMYDEPEEGIMISKRDIATKDGEAAEELPGATLIVTDNTGKEVERWESGEEPHMIVLEDGKYSLTEVTAPNGYEVAETIEFEVVDGKLKDGEMIIMYDEPTENTFQISKRDATTNKELPGAELTLENKTTGDKETWISTNEPHIITNPADGEYALTEVTAPEGYEVAESVSFEIKEGKVYVDGVESARVVMYDKPEDTHTATPSDATFVLQVSKRVYDTERELAGAELTLTNLDTGWSETWISSKVPHEIENPAEGNYILTEVSAPKGYRKAASIKFEIKNYAIYQNGDEVDMIIMYDKEKSNVSGGNSGSSSSSKTSGNPNGGPGVVNNVTDPGLPPRVETPSAPAPAAPSSDVTTVGGGKQEKKLPKTGDPTSALPAFMFLMSMSGAGAITLTDKKKKKQN